MRSIESILLLTLTLLCSLTIIDGYGTPPLSDDEVKNILPLTWFAPFLSGGGYCSEALSYVVQLHKRKLPHLSIVQHGDSYVQQFYEGLDSDVKQRVASMINSPLMYTVTPSITICHSEPGAWSPALYQTSLCPPPQSAVKIGRTMFETDRLPSGWKERLNRMDYIWVPTAFHANIFLEGGVEARKIRIIHEAVDTDFYSMENVDYAYDYPEEDPHSDKKRYKFLSIFKFEDRKGWTYLLDAYLSEFSVAEPVVLYILTNAYHSENDFQLKIEEYIRSKDWNNKERSLFPAIHLLPSGIPTSLMPSVYAGADSFVLPSRGEGWGRPHVEAMSMGLPVIATHWSGTTEFMTEDNSYPLQITGLDPILTGPFKGHMWATPDVNNLKFLMRQVYSDREGARLRGAQGRRDMVKKYCMECISRDVMNELRTVSNTYRAKAKLNNKDEL